MGPHDLLTIYSTKAAEYLVGVGYLLLFIPFWRYVTRPLARTAESVKAVSPALARDPSEWFQLPERTYYHPGHTWARVDGEIVTVGMDEFAGRLVGPVAALALPVVGATVEQGGPAWTLGTDIGDLPMLSPVDGTVIATNEDARSVPALVRDSPYQDGWVFKVRSPRLAANLKHLFTGTLARRWMEDVVGRLRLDCGMELGLVNQDGGQLLDGFARALDPDRPADAARRFLLTDDGGHHE